MRSAMMLRWGQEDIWQQTNSEEEGALGIPAVPMVQDAAPITVPIVRDYFRLPVNGDQLP
jgi:hypothetical protein